MADSAEMNEDRIITDTTDYADLDQELGSPSKTKIKDFEYPQSVEQWWTRTNFVRITSWISFWLSLYYFTDAVKISGQNLFPNELNQDWRANLTEEGNFIDTNSAATLMFAFIYLTGMIFVGVVIAINYRVETLIKTNLLNLQYFEINLVMHLWILFESFLVVTTLLYEYYANGGFYVLDFIIAFRIFPIIAAVIRLYQVANAIKTSVYRVKT